MEYQGNLHSHSDYSNRDIRDSIISLDKMFDTALQLNHKVLALTDHDCISGHIKALEKYQKIKKDNPDFKLILGNEIYLCRNGLNSETYQKGDKFYHFILLAKDKIGHQQIRELSTRAWLRSYKYGKNKRVPTYYNDVIDIIDNNKGHVIACTACLGSYLASECLALAQEPNKEQEEKVRDWLKQMVRLFGAENFYIELQPPAEKNNEQYLANYKMLEFAQELDIPWIVTTDAHYARPKDRHIHEAFLKSQDGEREVDAFYATTYMMSTQELESYFDFPLDEAYQNIQKIIDMCQDYDLHKSLRIPQLIWKTFNPKTDLKQWANKIPMINKFLSSDYIGDIELIKAIVERIESDPKLQDEKTYAAIEDNLNKVWESSLVNKTHWSSYFLNLQKIIDCCWEAGSLVLPGRGSGVGFILLYILGITQINPLWEPVPTYSWRFLNPSRVSVLDVDFDIEGARRSVVMRKFREIYGEDRVCNVITFGTEKSKSAIATAARGLDLNNDLALSIAALVPSDRGTPRTLKQCYYGDEENGFKPVAPFVQAMNENPELWEVAQEIEGLICRVGSHAGGVVFFDEEITDTASLMTTPEGLVVSCYELHDLEKVSAIKYDVLSVEAADKIHATLDLLIKNNKIKAGTTLKDTYMSYLDVYKLERNDPKMWDMVNNHEIHSLFQMEQQSGVQGISLTHPQCLEDLVHLNSVIRLMAQDKDAEQPLQKYARFKSNINFWYKEMEDYGLTKHEMKILEPYLKGGYGICENQELFMALVQIPECGGFDLNFADQLRKAIAKKNPKAYDELTKEYFKTVEEKGLSKNLCNYIWNVLVATSRGYGFNASHTLAYSLVGLQEMNLAYKYPVIYWNCGCLITDAGGEDGGTDYTKIAIALNKMRKDVDITLVDINKSDYNFAPDEENNTILYGMQSLVNVGIDAIDDIIKYRPYKSMADFINKVNPKRQVMIALIKAGAFDKFNSRFRNMVEYLWMTCDKKSKLTLNNMPSLIKRNLVPLDTEEMQYSMRIYEFNRYLKDNCKDKTNMFYKLDDRANIFINEVGLSDLIQGDNYISMNTWDNYYKKQMDVFRNWMKNDETLLDKLNWSIFLDDWNKYVKKPNLSRWEMESMCFYYHEHELAHINTQEYGIVEYKDLPEEPPVDYMFPKGDKWIPIYELSKIVGTCIAKDKNKGLIYLLTPQSGVVTVRLRKEYFALFDKQISEKQPDGKKKVIERSWFTRGNLLMVQGIRRGDEFVLKKYSRTPTHQLYLITDIDENNNIILTHERKKGELEEDE